MFARDGARPLARRAASFSASSMKSSTSSVPVALRARPLPPSGAAAPAVCRRGNRQAVPRVAPSFASGSLRLRRAARAATTTRAGADPRLLLRSPPGGGPPPQVFIVRPAVGVGEQAQSVHGLREHAAHGGVPVRLPGRDGSGVLHPPGHAVPVRRATPTHLAARLLGCSAVPWRAPVRAPFKGAYTRASGVSFRICFLLEHLLCGRAATDDFEACS